ncbi:hypothetical protein Dsin_014734 [Dipteronia sinensis]|uniref:Uncharacterized protein n=1 Tax=Dipteronia sinensis TaxID=43782 RepID=A0AAE0EAB0_9ROSI|nr:hypothetical protein Dsin_014734 [Dipteronia sinensis]
METTMMTKTTVANNTGPPQWTDERHLHFLKSMEASFVHTMLENNNGRRRHLRLDRQLPDTSDSTLDLKKHKPINKHVNPAADIIIIGSRNRSSSSNIDSKADKRPRRHSSSSYRPYIPPQDQVRLIFYIFKYRVPLINEPSRCDHDFLDAIRLYQFVYEYT